MILYELAWKIFWGGLAGWFFDFFIGKLVLGVGIWG